jgi:prevent-host-death family protein
MGSNWTLKDAEAEFVTIAEAARAGEPQRVTMPEDGAVVVVSAADYDRLSKRPKTLVEHILDFPKLPEGMEDFLDFDDRPQLIIDDIDFDD